MEHEVFVPVPAERLREALADPLRVARAVPGLQQDAGAEPVTGRLKVRVGGHTITYRGSARISVRDDGTYGIEGDAVEARGSGAVTLALVVRPTEAEGGTTLTFTGTASADGRITELPGDAVTSAVGRLLNRFAENLGNAARGPAPEAGESTEATEAAEASEVPEAPVVPEVPEAPEPSEAQEASEEFETPETPETPETAETPETPEPPAPSQAPTPDQDFTAPRDLPAEAAHARRTMIGRSAEEVDHAPPRGRYAPVPAPQTIAPNPALRWAAPAAAVVLASAIVVGRVLRKRR
ncbi:MAG: carbon monoxide dehydrogenase subunit G [Streptomyces sp.]|nr:carbon monoxide dehydrogenase subunit G [Streptomyces sp.]NUS15960.1 carbon monoxide dehydrogenase subunit G [Streptomyces sp.]